MQPGALTSQFDVALLALDAFVLFFIGLIYYLHAENKREGYPLISDRSERGDRHEGFPPMPKPKTFIPKHGAPIQVPRPEIAPPVAAVPTATFPGAPLMPTGNALVDGVGAAAYAYRAETPDLDWSDGQPRIIPLRLMPEFFLASADPDPRGMAVIAADGFQAGIVSDVWVDRSDAVIRYLEIDVAEGVRRVLAPMPLVKIDRTRRSVRVRTLLARHFAEVPVTASPDTVTLREEDRISAYYAGGQLYATAARAEPLI